jgi:hypothetical protein
MDQCSAVPPLVLGRQQSAIAKLKSGGAADEAFLRPLLEFSLPGRADVSRTFREPLHMGLELMSTAKRLSSVAAPAS